MVNHPNPFMMFSYMTPIMSVAIIVLIVKLGWFWSIGNGMNKYLTEELNLSLNRFRLFFSLLVVSLIIVFSAEFYYITNFLQTLTEGNIAYNYKAFIIITLALLISSLSVLACIIYVYFFLAKTVASLKHQREAMFEDYILYIIFFLFSFVGVWFVQPIINKVINSENKTVTDEI
jgi:hypothetical protein